jgi:hypothetical protein
VLVFTPAPSMIRMILLTRVCTIQSYECGSSRAIHAYLNQAPVRAALHVLSEAEIGPWGNAKWTSPYKRTVFNLADDYYAPLINSGRYRILIYSGDTDACMCVCYACPCKACGFVTVCKACEFVTVCRACELAFCKVFRQTVLTSCSTHTLYSC